MNGEILCQTSLYQSVYSNSESSSTKYYISEYHTFSNEFVAWLKRTGYNAEKRFTQESYVVGGGPSVTTMEQRFKECVYNCYKVSF